MCNVWRIEWRRKGNLKQDHLVYMQYTNLQDMTGKDIYESDILEQQTEWGGVVTTLRKVVKWNTSGWNIKSGSTRVVIGNVWENPELVQSVKK